MADQSDLLDIAQAAALLRVSETSLRRWTNAGRLPCFRVGGRRERRFRRADLLTFLERPYETRRGRPEGATGAGGGGGAHVHGHWCGLYRNAAARTRLAAEFLARGLATTGSTCVLVAEPRVREQVFAQLRRRPASGRRDLETGRVVAAAYRPTVAAQLELCETCFADATDAGAQSLWAVGDVSDGALGRRRPFENVIAYERAYDSLSRRYPVTTLCLYDARRLSGVEASRVLQVHGDMFRHPVDRLVS